MLNDQNAYKYIFEELLTLTDDGFIVVDTEGIVREINEQYCTFLGVDKAKAIGRSIFEIIHNSKMLDIVQLQDRQESVLHKFDEEKATDNVIVSRSCVFNDKHEPIGGVAQVKFRLQTLESAQKLMREYSELKYYKEEYQNISGNKYTWKNIIGVDAGFRQCIKAGIKAANTNFPVLLTGETGTGKEVFARAIHNSSSRSGKPLVSINCAAIPSELLESELFGYEEGSFTGAKKGGKKGKFEIASGGTVFLDEIADMPMNMQAKLLRVLQEKEIEKIGAVKPISVDIRVIAATRKNFPEMIKNGEFREDLYYRLNVINIEMIPLNKRKSDIILLANTFLGSLNAEYKTAIILSDEAVECLKAYSWPGNIRQLDNVIKSAYASCENFVIGISDLPPQIANSMQQHLSEADLQDKRLKKLMEAYETSIIKETLKKYNWNCRKAADDLGLHRSLLYKKMEKLGVRSAGE